jgi:protoporphyrinogen oxidase
MAVKNNKIIILGAGMTGLAAGFSSGLPVYESSDVPGGICSSYYIIPGETRKLLEPPEDNCAYRFEIGGGHWIFGEDRSILQFMRRFASLKKYARRSSVYFHHRKLFVPYPLQNHLRFLDRDVAARAIGEMSRPRGSARSMKQWLDCSFGPTLCEMFFYPFHHFYTAGLYDKIAPQDAYKSPVDLSTVIQGALNKTKPVGYNTHFVYPQKGLNELAHKLSSQCDIRYKMKAAGIDPVTKSVRFANGEQVGYTKIISTLPLNKTIQLTGIDKEIETDPYSSVLVLNIGAIKGDKCPRDHWLYTPDSVSGFHRVGFYSNVDRSFLPASARKSGDRTSIYVERAFHEGTRLSKPRIQKYADSVVAELQEWGFVKDAEVVDPTWIDVAYTWSWPDSSWKQWAMTALEEKGIIQVGRYGRWAFQGIADSIRDGLYVGAAFKPLMV